jgi:hypothetical protein
MNADLRAVNADLGSRIDALNTDLRAVNADLGSRIDRLGARMDEHLGRHAG